MATERTAWEHFSRYIRTRDCLESTGQPDVGKCFTCGVVCLIGDLDAGHFVKSTHKEIKFHEHNVHAQCTRCNRYLGGNEGEYAIRLAKKYGIEEVEFLLAQKHKPKCRSNQDFDDISKEYRDKLKNLSSPLSI